jgi:hypothetical protein
VRFCGEGVEFFLGFDKVTHEARMYLIEKPRGEGDPCDPYVVFRRFWDEYACFFPAEAPL